MKKALRIPLRIVFYREDNAIVAHCLEFDLLGVGDNHEEAIECLSNAMSMQLEEVFESKNFSNLFNPAPGEYLRMFAAGESDERLGHAVGALKVHFEPFDVTDVEGREYHENGPAEENMACLG